MKKIFSFVAVAFVALALVSCKPKPVAVLNQAKVDYAEMVAEAPDSLPVSFYEIEMVLDRPISDLNQGRDVRVISTRTVIQTDTLVTFTDRNYNQEGKIVGEGKNGVVGTWIGDNKIDLDSLVLDLPDVMKKLRETDTVLPETDRVVLRRSLMSPFNTYYIFGTQGTSFVLVNAITGEITTETPDSEEYVGIKEEEVAE